MEIILRKYYLEFIYGFTNEEHKIVGSDGILNRHGNISLFLLSRYKPKMRKKLKKQSIKVCGKAHKVSSINCLLALFATKEERKSTSQYFYLFLKTYFY